VLFSIPLCFLCILATKWIYESRARRWCPTPAHTPIPHPILSNVLRVNGVFLGPHSIKLYMTIYCEYSAKLAKKAAVPYPKYYPALTCRKWENSSKASVRTTNALAEIRTGTCPTEVHSVSW